RALLSDEVLVDLARRPPRDAQRLAQVRHMPRPLAERYSQQMLDAIERGRSAQPLPTCARAPEPSLTEKFAADAAFSLLQTMAVGRGIDPSLLASRREIESFARLAATG